MGQHEAANRLRNDRGHSSFWGCPATVARKKGHQPIGFVQCGPVIVTVVREIAASALENGIEFDPEQATAEVIRE